MRKHCCNDMEYYLSFSIDSSDTSDTTVIYDEVFDEYGILIHDGGYSKILIVFCPWCGTRLPESKRDLWFEKLGLLGIDAPFEQDIPNKYNTSEWWELEEKDNTVDVL